MVGINLYTIYNILEEIGKQLLSKIPQITYSILAIIIGFVFIRLVRNKTRREMSKQRLGEHLSHTLITIVQWITVLVVISIILLQFGLNIAAITGFLSVVGGTIIGFAAINTVGNAIAGFIIMMSRPFKVGDRIFFKGRFSDVISINLIYTKLRTPSLVYINVPNQELIKTEVDNYGKKNIIRLDVSVTAGYDDDRIYVKDALLSSIKNLDYVLKAPLPFVRITAFQNNAIQYTLYYFIRNIKRMPWIEADVKDSIMDTFIERGIDLRTPNLIKSANGDPSQTKADQKRQSITIRPGAQKEEIMKIEGIGPIYSEKLNSVYIYSVSDLLEAGKTREGRKDIAEKTGISSKLILKWVNLADLFRIDGVGKEYSELLESAGVDTVVELARRKPSNLYKIILKENEAKNFVRRVPTQEMIEEWIEQAKSLPRKISY